MMQIAEIRALTTENLREELDRAHKELFNLRFQKATRQLADFTAIGKTRKNIARLETVLRERAIAEQATQ